MNPADNAVITLAASSDTLPLTSVQDLVNTRVALKLSQISGVGMVTLAGGHQPAIRVQMDPKALAAHGLTLEDVNTLIGDSNVNGSKGVLTASTIRSPSMPTTNCVRRRSTAI